MGTALDSGVERLGEHALLVWVVALVFFGVGDLATTAVGLSTGTAKEVSPVVRFLAGRYGVASLVLLKAYAFLACGLLWRVVPGPYDVGVPIGVTVVGVAVTAWNVSVLLPRG